MITDDHSLIREGLKQLLELEGDFQVIAEACDGIDCMEKLKEQIPDVLLLDIKKPVYRPHVAGYQYAAHEWT